MNNEIIIQQPTNKKYLVDKFDVKYKDQNDNQSIIHKEEQFLNKGNIGQESQNFIHCSDGIMKLDDNGNEIVSKKKYNLESSNKVIDNYKNWKILDNIDSPVINTAANVSYNVGRKTLNAIDYLGNFFASLVGITEPKFNREITQAKFDEKNKIRHEEKIKDAEAGWK